MKITLHMFAALVAAILMVSCQDDVSQIGSILEGTDVNITVDSTFSVKGEPVYTPRFDSRSATKLLGRITVPEYGELRCSFVSQMLAASSLAMPDSIPVEHVDSMRMVLTVPRGALTGDSLAPQQLSLYALNKQLPTDITNQFDPQGYYSESTLMGRRSFTLSALAMSDSLMAATTTLKIPITLPAKYAQQVAIDYRTNPDIFAWPTTFNQYLPGIYVEPSFGSGCIANINKVEAFLYWHYQKEVTTIEDNETVTSLTTVADSVAVFATAPEVLSSNNINLTVAPRLQSMAAAGECVVMSPAGYNVRIHLPVEEILERYHKNETQMKVINDLTLTIPATKIENDYGIAPAPYLLMVPTSELDTFFAENKVPDSTTSFWGSYSSETGKYSFSSLRDWLEAKAKGESTDEGDTAVDPGDFTLIPVNITTQDKQISYSQTVTIVTACTPYMTRPTMCVLDVENADLVLTYSSQIVE